ncbi:pre-mRNA-processing factor 19 [Folsomia candida]|uniref:Pre-mRNA-processing factor 19 n=1 Tax=Folsomia candida TaxID=158441 RepID=A0A226F027_FOLCA|nr:pre-mRNA-processing factor 19 [Folsomia candida]OXA62747.1 Pre-mRNA-processing factor 19 [Folsomia candida]
MALVCAISNHVPDTAVIAPTSGTVFEKRLIEKLLAENGGKDPINGEPLDIDQLIEIKAPAFVKPKPPSCTSIPAILKILQDEWDAMALHSFTLSDQLNIARKELSLALYEREAACRVIARLTDEVAEARGALATLKPQTQAYVATGGQAGAFEAAGGQTVAIGISAEIHQKLQDTAAVLTQERKRKGKAIPQNLASAEAIKEYQVIASHTGLHSASSPGILCLDIQGSTVVTGGNDKIVTVFNKESEQVVASMKGHSKKVISVLCHQDETSVLSGSLDCTIRLWDAQSSQLRQVIRAHDGAITGLSLHATGDYILSSSMDQYWAFSDFRTGSVLAKVIGDEESPLFAAKFHPDGLICAIGTLKSVVRIWDLKEQSNVANFPGHNGRIISIAFSENGYYLATAAEDACVKLWDLRKLKNFKTIEMADNYSITDLAFDQTGTYLAVSGSDVRVYGCKLWNEIAVYNDHTGTATGVRFGQNASFIASTSLDRSLKIYGEQQ